MNMKRKNVSTAVTIVMTLTAIAAFMSIPAMAWAEEPSYPASIYIETIYPWDNYQGVSILLTPTGWLEGTYWDGAYMLAGYTISDYEYFSGTWPYN